MDSGSKVWLWVGIRVWVLLVEGGQVIGRFGGWKNELERCSMRMRRNYL